VSEDDAHRGDKDDRSVGAFAVKPAPSARRYTALGSRVSGAAVSACHAPRKFPDTRLQI